MKTTPVWNCDANPAFRIVGAKRRRCRTGDGGGTSEGAERRWRIHRLCRSLANLEGPPMAVTRVLLPLLAVFVRHRACGVKIRSAGIHQGRCVWLRHSLSIDRWRPIRRRPLRITRWSPAERRSRRSRPNPKRPSGPRRRATSRSTWRGNGTSRIATSRITGGIIRRSRRTAG